MPVTTTYTEEDLPRPLEVRDLKEGEVYLEDDGYFVLVLTNNDEAQKVVAAVHNGKENACWFAYTYPYDGGQKFSGPYRAEIKVYGAATVRSRGLK